MAEQIYYSVFTKKGLELLTEAIRNGTKLGITSMAFGDGGGSLPVPNEEFTQLINEVHRTQLNSLAPDPNNANWLRAEAIIASAVGGFNIRELGLYAGDVLVAYSNYPATYKPNPSDGTARIMTFRMVLQIDNTASFDLIIDADIVLATIQSVNDAKAELYENTVNQVDSFDELSTILKVENKTVYVKQSGIYKCINDQWVLETVFNSEFIPISQIIGSKNNIDISEYLTEIAKLGINVLIDIDCSIHNTVTISNSDIKIKGVKGKWIKQFTQTMFNVVGEMNILSNLNIDTNGYTYGITESGQFNEFINLKFKGNVGHYIICMGVKPHIYNCSHEAGYNQTTPFVFSGATEFLIEKCNLLDYTGFGIQARFCKGGKMSNCYADPKIAVKRVQVSESSTEYTVDMGESFSRFGLTWTDGDPALEVPIAFSVSAISGTTQYKFTIANPGGSRILSIYGSNALESYQVNSGCSDITVEGCTSTGTGDSNIVVGCDYHWNGTTWVLDPSSVISSDEPINTKIIDNNCDMSFHASIAINHGQGATYIENNRLGNAGICFDSNGAFNTNILHNGTGVITGNSFQKVGAFVRSNITCLRLSTESYKIDGAGLTIANNNIYSKWTTPIRTDFRAINFAASDTNISQRQGVIISGNYSKIQSNLQKIFESDFVNDMPVNTEDWVFSNGNGYLRKSTTQRVSGLNSVFLDKNTVIDCSANENLRNELSNKLVRVRFWCFGKGNILIFPLYRQQTASIYYSVNTESWQQREIIFPTAQLITFIVRLSSSDQANLHIQNIEIEYLDYN